MTGEHLWSDWIGKLFPPTTYRFRQRSGDFKTTLKKWSKPAIDLKSRDVCKACNEGWMSDLESQHAKPAMKDMILHTKAVPLTPHRIAAISAFAFKTAVVAEHMKSARTPFFPAHIRRQFAETLEVPPEIFIWLASFSGIYARSGIFKSAYYQGTLPDGNGFEAYVFTWSAGHLVFQLFAPQTVPALGKALSGSEHYELASLSDFHRFIVPIWPYEGGGLVWPTAHHLGDDSIKQFADRWRRLRVFASGRV